MSARSRRARGDNLDVLSNSAVLSPAETDASIFGSLDRADAGRQVAKPISIFEVHPDSLQPRRAVPSPVRPYWDGRPVTTSVLFSHWYDLAVQERGEGAPEFNVRQHLLAEEEVPRPESSGPIDMALLDIVELAANIRANGLTNPITIAQTQNGYRLETGERRWLAYHLLFISFEDEQEKWGRIPARVVDEFSVWRQASENNARSNLNAISKARQLAILIMDLYQRQGVEFQSYDMLVGSGGCDRLFYSQVGEGDGGFAIPKGHGEALLAAGGFKTSSQLREHRALLRLPDEVWRIADDLNWTQGRIRALQRKSAGSDNLLISLALNEAKAQRYKVGINFTDSPTLFDDVPDIVDEDEDAPLSGKKFKRYRRVIGLIKAVGEGRRRFKDHDLFEIQQMRDWLVEVEKVARIELKKK
ncbi:MAG: ParB N-terminal domain-containing protein [Anaerolineae bacterium]